MNKPQQQVMHIPPAARFSHIRGVLHRGLARFGKHGSLAPRVSADELKTALTYLEGLEEEYRTRRPND